MIQFKRHAPFILALLPLLSLAMTSIALLIFVFAGILSYREKFSSPKIEKKERVMNIFWLSLPVSMYLFTLMWTNNLNSGYSFLERSAALFIVPLVIFVTKLFQKKAEIKRFIKVYIFSSFILSILFLTHLGIRLIIGKLTYSTSDYFSVLKLRSEISDIPIINEHPIYLSLLLGTALIFLFFNRFTKLWWNITITIVLILLILIASSRGPILALITCFSGLIYLQFKNKIKATLLVLLFFLAVGLVGFYTPLKSRILEIINTSNMYPQDIRYNSFNLRMGIYKCDFEVAQKTPIFGFGAGDVQQQLDQCYTRFDTEAYSNDVYNSHNQYLFYWMAFGPVGFIAIIFSYFLFVRRAIIYKDYCYGFFLLFFFISFFTENVMSRNTGIMIFGIFNSIFYYRTYLENDSY